MMKWVTQASDAKPAAEVWGQEKLEYGIGELSAWIGNGGKWMDPKAKGVEKKKKKKKQGSEKPEKEGSEQPV
ncbi:hypothetical protein NLJ89_g12417 [Agrocybe chaxingu]|uniref:Uncharacterized protein n=1 Tax=Agrocybe chaxingu TaxID=84603 RepID=A0A9W8MP37_9AGAR|nr:hypothetical protein NLJ89_g12417 [Agrocybe chaxingu]